MDAPQELWSDGTFAVHALPVPIGRECAAIQALRQDPAVAFAELDHVVRVADVVTPNDPGWAYQWGPAKINAPTAWDITTGTTGVTIAVVDTGVQMDHGDLNDNVWINPGETVNGIDDDGNGYVDDIHGWDFVHDDNDSRDDHGHGTHVAGIAGARINNGLGIAGMAGGARLMSIKVIRADNTGTYSDLAEGIIYAVDNGARVINLSIGGEPPSGVLQAAVDYAHDRGALLVAAAGNTDGDVLYPGASEHALAVSATEPDDDIWPDSCQGPEMDVAAPGAAIYSTGWSSGSTSHYHYLWGSSMATPHVAGLAALIWSARPDLTNVQVTEAITSTAVDVNEPMLPGWDAYAGWGRIEASEAMGAAQGLPLNAYGVDMTPSRATVTATMGSLATYTLTVKNVGNARDAYDVELDGHAWEAIPSRHLVGPVDADGADTLEITVAIPIAAGDGVTDTLNVTVASVNDPTQSATSTLTTKVAAKTVYLPIIQRAG
jgi:subtilisin family serine protease